MTLAFTYCSFCGAQYRPEQPWPRVCASCGNTTYRNPLPVSVVLLPVDAGLLAVRRAIEPRRGQLALPGGFINHGESWQAAGAREVFEETGIALDPATIREFSVRSAPDGTVLIFGLAAPIRPGRLPAFVPNEETSELAVITQAVPLAFPLHTAVVTDYFSRPGGRT